MNIPSAPLIGRAMPDYSVRQLDRVAVAASPERAYTVCRSVDMSRITFVRLLFELRILPERLLARLRRQPYTANLSSCIDDITRVGSGFIVLAEEPGHEVVIGSIGKFWQPAIEFAAVTPDDFATFSVPGYAKLAWCIRVDPRSGGGSWLTVEVRVGATDSRSLARFHRYWSLIGRFSHAIRRAVLKLLLEQLGPVAPESERPMPGDGLLPHARFQRTHTTTIEAPVDRVWPWLVQMGARRAGWYSFDLLDNGGQPSAEHIMPELQSLKVGDIIPSLPSSESGFAVLILEPPRTLVLGAPSLLDGRPRSPEAPSWDTTWAFSLEPIGASATQLTVRTRADYAPSVKMAATLPLIAAAHEVMERRQLRNLRRRAEASATL